MWHGSLYVVCCYYWEFVSSDSGRDLDSHTGTETRHNLYLELWIFWNIIGAIVLFAEVSKTRHWKMVWRRFWLNFFIGGRSMKGAKGNSQVLIFWRNIQRELTPTTSSWALSRVFDLLEYFDRDRSYGSPEYWDLTNKEEVYEEGCQILEGNIYNRICFIDGGKGVSSRC